MADNKSRVSTKLQVDVDIDLRGRVTESQKLVKSIQQSIDALVGKLSSSKQIHIDFSLKSDLDKLTKEVTAAKKKLELELSTLGKSREFALSLGAMIDNARKTLGPKATLLRQDLKKMVADVAKETGNTKAFGDSFFKNIEFLSGQPLKKATQSLSTLANGYARASAKVAQSSKDLEAKLEKNQQVLTAKGANAALAAKKRQEFLTKFAPNEKALALKAQVFKDVTAPGSLSSDVTRTKAVTAYTDELQKLISKLNLAKDTAKEFGISQKEIDNRIKELKATLGKVDPKKFDLTGNLRDSVKGTAQAAKVLQQALLNLEKQRVAFQKAADKNAFEGTVSRTSLDAKRAVEGEIKALKDLIYTLQQVDKYQGSNNQKEIDDHLRRVGLLKEEGRQIKENLKAANAIPKVSKSEVEKAQDIVAKAKADVATARHLTESASAAGSDLPKREKVRLAQAELRAQEKLVDSYRKLAEAEKNFGGISSSTASALRKEEQALTRVSEATGKVSKSWDFFRRLQLAQDFIAIGLILSPILALINAVKDFITSAIQLQAALVGIKAIAGATAAEMVTISKAVLDVARKTNFSTLEIAKGGQTLAQAGVKIKDFGKTLQSVANLASATGSTFEESADIMTTFKQIFEDVAPDEIADKLRNAVNISKLTVGDLKTIGNFLLETADSFNISIDSFGAAAATLRNAGIKASTIGTGLRQGLLELFRPDTKTIKGLQAQYATIGQNLSEETIQSMFAGFANAKDPILALINELEKLGVGGVGDNQFTRVLDVRAENAIKTLVRQKDAYIQNTVAIKETGTAVKGAQTQLEALTNSWQNFVETLKGGVFSALEGTIGQLAGLLKASTDALDKFKEFRLAGIFEPGSQRSPGSKESGLRSRSTEELTAAKTAAEQSKTQIEQFHKTIKEMQDVVGTYAGDANLKEIQGAMEAASKGVVAIGSKSLEDFAAQLEAITGRSVGDKQKLAGDLQKVDTVITEANQARAEYIKQYQQALSDLSEGKNIPTAEPVVQGFLDLTEAQRQLLQRTTTSLGDAQSTIEVLGKRNELDRANIETDLAKLAKVNPLATLGEELAGVQEAYRDYLAGTNKSQNFAKLSAALNTAVTNGQTEVVKAIVEGTGGLFSQDNLKTAFDNKKAAEFKKLQDQLKAVQAGIKADEIPLTDAAKFEETAAKKRADIEAQNKKNQERREQLDAELTSAQTQLIESLKAAQEIVASGSDDKGSKDRLAQLDKDIANQKLGVKAKEDQIAMLTQDQVDSAEKLAEVQRSLLPGQQQVKQLQERLKILQSDKNHTVESETALLKEIYGTEKQQLDVEQQALRDVLAREIEKERLFKTTTAKETTLPDGTKKLEEVKLNAAQLIERLAGTAGKEALAKSEDLAKAYTALTEVVDKESLLREKYLTDLENAQRKELEAKLKDAQGKLDQQQSRTLAIENNLQTASQKLQTARENLANAYEKHAELESFFAASLREISGKPLSKSDIQDTLADAQRSGSAEVAKQAVEQTKQLFSQGKIGRSEAESNIAAARDIALRDQENEINKYTQQVIAAAVETSNLSQALNESYRIQSELNQSVVDLTAQIGNIETNVQNQFKQPEVPQSNADHITVTPSPAGGVFQRDEQGLPIIPPQVQTGLDGLNIDPRAASAVVIPTDGGISAPQQAATNTLQPVTFSINGNSLDTVAQPDAVSQFTAATRIQSLKSGRRT